MVCARQNFKRNCSLHPTYHMNHIYTFSFYVLIEEGVRHIAFFFIPFSIFFFFFSESFLFSFAFSFECTHLQSRVANRIGFAHIIYVWVSVCVCVCVTAIYWKIDKFFKRGFTESIPSRTAFGYGIAFFFNPIRFILLVDLSHIFFQWRARQHIHSYRHRHEITIRWSDEEEEDDNDNSSSSSNSDGQQQQKQYSPREETVSHFPIFFFTRSRWYILESTEMSSIRFLHH